MFAKRKLVLPVVLATAAGAPYLAMEDGWSHTAKEKLQSFVSSAPAASATSQAKPGTPVAEIGLPAFQSEFTISEQAEVPRTKVHASITGPAANQFADLIRFDVSPNWVTQRWPRVTTTTAETGMEGLRVPVVTGTRIDDIAGTCTYYFDHNHQLQRLSFDGYTGDDRRLTELLSEQFGLKREPTLEANMYVARWNARPTSVLLVERAPVITADSPHSRFHLMLELNRPNAYFGLSPQFAAILERSRAARRW